MNEMRKWKRLFETAQVTARLKDGREVSLNHFEDFEDGLHCLEVYATLDGEMVGTGKYDMNTGEFRGIEVEPAFRRLGIASAIYDHVEQLGYDVKPSPHLQPGGIAFWTTRQTRQRTTEAAEIAAPVPAFIAHLHAAVDRAQVGFYFEEGGCWGMALALYERFRKLGFPAELAVAYFGTNGAFHAMIRSGTELYDYTGEARNFSQYKLKIVTPRGLLQVARWAGHSRDEVMSARDDANEIIDSAIEMSGSAITEARVGAVRELPSSVAELEEWGYRIGVSATVFEHPQGSIELSEIHRRKGAPKGCGAEFILALCAYADRRHKRLFLTVTGGNEQLENYYRRFGFKAKGRTRDKETADVVMARAPSPNV